MADRYDERYRGEDWRRERGHYGRDYDRDRGFLDRAGDELRSWFGDDEAERRRRMDEARYGRPMGRDYGRDYGRDRGDRGLVERSGDEVRSWFGDDEAERRRRMDEARYGRDWDRYGRDADRYGREWDYGHRMGFDYGRPRERGWGEERSGGGERESGRADYGRPGWPGANDPAYGGTAYTRPPAYTTQGPFFGRGPRGYQRSDERVREEVCERLTHDPWIDASEVEVTVRGGEVTLTGTVRDRSDKRHAEDLAEHVSGVREIHNNLRVSGSGAWEGTAGREQTPTTGTTPVTGTTSRR